MRDGDGKGGTKINCIIHTTIQVPCMQRRNDRAKNDANRRKARKDNVLLCLQG